MLRELHDLGWQSDTKITGNETLATRRRTLMWTTNRTAVSPFRWWIFVFAESDLGKNDSLRKLSKRCLTWHFDSVCCVVFLIVSVFVAPSLSPKAQKRENRSNSEKPVVLQFSLFLATTSLWIGDRGAATARIFLYRVFLRLNDLTWRYSRNPGPNLSGNFSSIFSMHR